MEVLEPTGIHILWHSWHLPTVETAELQRETVELLARYLEQHYQHVHLKVSFDEEMVRAIECHLDFDYAYMLPSQREQANREHIRRLSELIGDVMRYFVKRDSMWRMMAERNRRGGYHDAYGLGAETETIPYPPDGERHMPRAPLVWDKRRE